MFWLFPRLFVPLQAEFVRSVLFGGLRATRVRGLEAPSFVGKDEKQVLRLVSGNLENFNNIQDEHSGYSYAMRRVIVSLYLYVIGIPEPPLRDVERAMILRFFVPVISK